MLSWPAWRSRLSAQVRSWAKTPGAADATGVLGQGDIAHMVQGVFDGPVVAHGMVGIVGRELAGADVVGRLATRLPVALGGAEDIGVAAHLDEASAGRPLVAQPVRGHGPDRGVARFDAVALLSALVVMVRAAGLQLLGQRRDAATRAACR